MRLTLDDFCSYDRGRTDYVLPWWTRLRVTVGAAIFGRENIIVLVEGHARLMHGPSTGGRADGGE